MKIPFFSLYFILASPSPQDNVLGNMFCVQSAHHESPSWTCVERWKWLGRLDARTSKHHAAFDNFISFNKPEIGIFLSFCALCSLSRILGMRVNNSTATWRTTRLSRTIRTVTSQHITATDKPKSKTKLARTTDRHSARMEWDEHETQSKATAESSRDFGRLSEKSTVAQNQQ